MLHPAKALCGTSLPPAGEAGFRELTPAEAHCAVITRKHTLCLPCSPPAGEAEFRELTPAEAQLLRQACEPVQGSSSSSGGSAAAPPVSSFDGALLQGLYKRGLVYLEVPVAADDRISLPPLEVRKTKSDVSGLRLKLRPGLRPEPETQTAVASNSDSKSLALAAVSQTSCTLHNPAGLCVQKNQRQATSQLIH
jgi:hypothetical protein